MTSANNEVIKRLRDVIQNGGGIDVNTRDVLLFSAIIDIYEQIENSRSETQKAIAEARAETKRVIEETRPAIIFYRVGIWFASVLGISVIGFLFSLMTGRAEIIFK